MFNSRSASVGETLIALKIQECEEAGMEFEQVIEQVNAFIDEQHTYFVLESLDALRKNGRLTGIKALVATALNVKPVMGATPGRFYLSVGTGQRYEEGSCKDGRQCGSRSNPPGTEDSCNFPL